VKATIYTGEGGAMMLRGSVADNADLQSLAPYVEALGVPVTIVYRVTLDTYEDSLAIVIERVIVHHPCAGIVHHPFSPHTAPAVVG
jgi:hypothetical protein